jgi:NAD-dependent deacetylase
MSESQSMFPNNLLTALRTARHVAVLTGAGISAESGLATFREAQTGLWAQFRPEDLATPQAFAKNPRLVWEWYAWRREQAAQAEPNSGHYALVSLAQHVPKFTLITQNVDSLHERAGSHDVIELHGNIMRTKCSNDGALVEAWAPTDVVPPHCPRCNGLLRPDVVWFDEMLPEHAIHRALAAARSCDFFLSIGTSGVVEPAASLPRLAQQHRATVVYINLDVQTAEAGRRYAIHGKAGHVLPALVKAAWPAD